MLQMKGRDTPGGVAERRLRHAVRSGQTCDFSPAEVSVAGDMTGWGPERTVTGAFVRELLVGNGAGDRPRGVRCAEPSSGGAPSAGWIGRPGRRPGGDRSPWAEVVAGEADPALWRYTQARPWMLPGD